MPFIHSIQPIASLWRKLFSFNGNGSDRGYRNTEANHERELKRLRMEIEVLRNEILENVAAIHRLEVLTLSQRAAMLKSFGKLLQPMNARRTKESLKPRGYTFGIITDGQCNEKLARLIDSIRAQNVSPDSFEILVAGCVADFEKCAGVRVFHMEEPAQEGRLGAMRNVLARAAGFNKFVSLDDDFIMHPKWVDAVEEVDDDFDVATGVIVNPDLSRYCDWVNLIGDCSFLRGYHEGFDDCQYVTGGFGIYKDYIFEKHCWDENLGFYQGEDVQLSRRLFKAGYQLKFIPKAVVMHDDERYRQKGYGVIRINSGDTGEDSSLLEGKLSQFCPRSL